MEKEEEKDKNVLPGYNKKNWNSSNTIVSE
jgi:hypothetical protein